MRTALARAGARLSARTMLSRVSGFFCGALCQGRHLMPAASPVGLP